jgi:predicted ATPase
MDPTFIRTVTLLREQVPDFNRYPFNLPVLRELDSLELHPRVTFFAGENGSGKSTLLEAIATAAGFNPEGGTRSFNFATRSSESELHRFLRLVRGYRRPRTGFFLRAESYFNVGTVLEQMPDILQDAYGGTSPHEQSYWLSKQGLSPIAYEDTEHYRLTRDFLLHRERYLHELMKDGDED